MSELTDRTLVMILAGGEGRRLYPLTKDRAKPAVPFGGKYRIIDFVLSNFVNSGFFKIKTLTQFKSNSLNKHLNRGWRLSPTMDHYVEPIPAQMRMGRDWFKGNADAIYQNMDVITDENPKWVCVFGGDHIYRMDVRQMMNYHNEKQAEATIAAIPKPISEAKEYGVIEVDKTGRMVGFQEKPDDPKPMPNDPSMVLASMGNYIFNTDALIRELQRDAEKDSAHDFGKDIISYMYENHPVYVYDFAKNVIPDMTKAELGYWRDVGTIDAYWAANMDMVSVSPTINLYNKHWPIRTAYYHHPPAKFVFANEAEERMGIATDSLVSEGSIISGGHIDRCVISPRVRINSYSYVSESILMEGVNVGRRAKIKRAIIDKDVDIPPDMEIGYDLEKDRERFTVSEGGIVVIPRRMKIDPPK